MHLADVDGALAFLHSLDGVFDAPPPWGDPVDLLAHGLQCAAILRKHSPGDAGLQLAGLLHDIGHAVGDPDPDHARTGAEVLRPLFGDRVAALIALHVDAKRYLAATEAYQLSEASRLSLERQGAAMTVAAAQRFETGAHAADAIALRRADEAAKVVGLDVPGLDTWAPVIRKYVAYLG